jgi:hypothetical protein
MISNAVYFETQKAFVTDTLNSNCAYILMHRTRLWGPNHGGLIVIFGVVEILLPNSRNQFLAF